MIFHRVVRKMSAFIVAAVVEAVSLPIYMLIGAGVFTALWWDDLGFVYRQLGDLADGADQEPR